MGRSERRTKWFGMLRTALKGGTLKKKNVQ